MRYLLLLAAFTLHAETGSDAWLRHAPLDDAAARPYRTALPAVIATFTATPVVQSAQGELVRGIRGMLGRTERIQTTLPAEPALILGTLADLKPLLKLEADLPPDGYWLATATAGGVTHLVVTAANDRGVLEDESLSPGERQTGDCCLRGRSRLG